MRPWKTGRASCSTKLVVFSLTDTEKLSTAPDSASQLLVLFSLLSCRILYQTASHVLKVSRRPVLLVVQHQRTAPLFSHFGHLGSGSSQEGNAEKLPNE